MQRGGRDLKVVLADQRVHLADRARDLGPDASVSLARQRDLADDPFGRKPPDERLAALEPRLMRAKPRDDASTPLADVPA